MRAPFGTSGRTRNCRLPGLGVLPPAAEGLSPRARLFEDMDDACLPHW
jgi:hypothetical protein